MVEKFLEKRKSVAQERIKEVDFPPMAMMYGDGEATGEVVEYDSVKNLFSFPMDKPGENTFPGDGRVTHRRLQLRDWPWKVTEYATKVTHSKQMNDIEVLNTALSDLRKAFDARVKVAT